VTINVQGEKFSVSLMSADQLALLGRPKAAGLRVSRSAGSWPCSMARGSTMTHLKPPRQAVRFRTGMIAAIRQRAERRSRRLGSRHSRTAASACTRELSRIVTFYLRNVRKHELSELFGIYRQMRRITDQGVTTKQMAQAARNYAKSAFVKSIPETRRHHIRRFFRRERVRQWAVHRETVQQDRSLAALDGLARAAMAAQIPPRWYLNQLPASARTYHVSGARRVR